MHSIMRTAAAIVVLPLLLISCGKEPTVAPQGGTGPFAKKPAPDTAVVTVFARGLNNPRGLTFGPDGFLYVAEGGSGGTDSTVGLCPQVPPPVGPYKGSPTGSRISKISPQGALSTVVEGLPSSQTGAALGSFVSGVADVAFIDGTLYGLLSGAGCSHGVPSVPNGVFRVNGDGSWDMIANLSAFFQSHPVAHPEEEDFEPDGTPYSMVAVRGDLYVVEANQGQIDKVTTGGVIERLVDVSASQGHAVPTSITYHGNFYLGNLGTFPVQPGTQHVFQVTPGGHLNVRIDGLTAVLGIAFDNRGRLYVLETSTMAGNPAPGTGKVVRVSETGVQEVIASGLTLPTAMTLGPDGNLYVSNVGFGPPPIGLGEVLKLELTDTRGGGS